MPKCPKDCNKPNPLIFRKIEIPAAMGDDKTYPPKNGAYCNALVVYAANNHIYFYTSDGIPVKIPTAITDYNELTHKPMINGVELVGDVTLEELGIVDLVNAEAEARAAADEELQDAIDDEVAAREAADQEIIGQIPTVNDATLTIQKNGSQVAVFTANSATDITANIEVPTATSALINDSGYITNTVDNLVNYYTKAQTDDAIADEAAARAGADNDLQEQIDAIAASSDVVDIVGTKADLNNYDTTKLHNNDIVKVLADESQGGATTYYRWSTTASTWSYIGAEGPYYTKSESDSTFVPQTRTVNNKALSSDITLTAADVGALPSSTVIPTVNDATLTIQKNGTNVATFTANSATNATANISVPTKTSDLTNDGADNTSTYVEADELATVATTGSYADLTNKPTIPTKTSDLTNDSNFVSDANYVHTDNNFTTTLKNKLDGIAAGAEVNVQSDWSQTDTTADDFIKNKPTIPTKTSDLTNDGEDGTSTYVEAADLATVATTGAYSDLTGTPTIPTVNNATLTIQRNSTTVDTFTANSATDKTVNIAVPTATSDLTNDSGYITNTDYASANTGGVIKVGTGLSIDANGVLSSNGLTSVDWSDVTNKPTNVSYWTNDAGYITSASLPTKTSDLTNDGSDGTSTYVEADDLATVATSGSYNDLSNKPTIPTVNDATLTIQRNSTTVDTFTANASVNKTINIAVPTATSDLTNDSGYITISSVPTKTSDLTNDGSDGTAQYLETDETAYRTTSIPYGKCDSTSTSTVFTATVPGITELRDGVCMWLKNGVVTSASGFTININSLGAKPVYQNMAAATRDTTLWNVNYTMFFVYDSTRVEGGCWILYRGYNSDTNTIAYQIRTNSTALTTTDRTRYYRILFTSADNTQWVPANTQYDNSATSSKTVNQRKINPFGRIVYMTGTTNVPAGSAVGATTVWDQYALNLGYSFAKGSALTMTYPKPVYIKCAPQSDGSAIIDSTNPFVQDLPSTEDGKIYIYLGIAYSATNVEMVINHPIYYYKDSSIREWTNAAAGLASVAWGDITGTLTNQTDLNTALGAKANSADLATVATSGSYNDLTNKPTIPTVNNATLTITRNNVSAGTFTANAASNATIDISVPTATSDLTNDSGFITTITKITNAEIDAIMGVS